MKKSLGILLVLTIIINLIIVPLTVLGADNTKKQFKDVDSKHWAYDYIIDMMSRNIIDGYEDGSFKPNSPVLRAEFSKMLAGLLKVDTSIYTTSLFTDVKPTDWFLPYVESTKEWFEGKRDQNGNDVFLPNENANRLDITIALVKANRFDISKANTSVVKNKFKDCDNISEEQLKYVAVAVSKNLIKGYEDKTFRPDQSVTRAEAATLLYRGFKDYKTPTPPPTATPTPKPTATPKPTKTPVPVRATEGSLALVKTISKTIDSSGNNEYKLYLIQDNKEISFNVSSLKVVFYKLNGEYIRAESGLSDYISKGDTIKYSINSSGDINNIALIFDYSERKLSTAKVADSQNYGYVFGKVTDIGSSFEISNDTDKLKFNKIKDIDPTFSEYDASGFGDGARVIKEGDLEEYQESKKDYYYFVVRLYNGRAQDIVQYKLTDIVDESNLVIDKDRYIA